MNALRWCLGRLFESLLTLLVLCVVCFALLHATPGGPFDQERVLPPELEAQITARYRLDEPLHTQFTHYLGGVLRGDLGPSFQYPDFTVVELIRQAAPITLTLGLMAMLLATAIGVGLGVCAAWRGGRVDQWLSGISALGLAIPKFVLAPILIFVMAVSLGWLPAGGWSGENWKEAVLPIIALTLPNVAVIAKLMRASTLEVLASDYVRAARSRGIAGAALLRRHVLRPALMPVLAWLTPMGIAVLSGSAVVESVFGLPGLGKYFVQGALNRDYTLVLGIALFNGLIAVLLSFLVDAIRRMMDPRLQAD